MSMRDEDSIVVLCSTCKNMLAVMMNEPRVMTSDRFSKIGKLVDDGHTVEHWTAEKVRRSEFCKCER